MSGSSIGDIFRITTFGESHGRGLGVIVDGVPSNIEITEAEIQRQLDRRKPGQSAVTTPRQEADKVQFMSGVFAGKTTGTPFMMLILNQDQRSKDYSNIKELFRPGHADWGYHKKYGIRDYRGGGRSSGRETAVRVAAGALAQKILLQKGVEITAHTAQVGNIKAKRYEHEFIEKNTVRTGDPAVAADMERLIKICAQEHDSIGGIVECRITGVPAGIGEPVFAKFDARLAQAVISIGGIKGVEFGAGFNAATMRGTEHNDAMTQEGFESNNAGGILGGISSGNEIIFRAAVKPTPSVAQEQMTVNLANQATTCQITGRHDPCLCPRIVPVVEAMSAITILDLFLQHNAYQNF